MPTSEETEAMGERVTAPLPRPEATCKFCGEPKRRLSEDGYCGRCLTESKEPS